MAVSMSDHPSRLNWITVGALCLFHAGALAALFLFTWPALWTALALLWISGGWGIGMGYHRLLTHRGYETPRWLEYTLAVCGALALQGGPLFWVATHRLHHQNADKSGDPHSPRDGWWWAHAGWLVRGDPMRDTALAPYVPDLRRDSFHCWLEKWHVVPMLVLSVVLAVMRCNPRGRVPGSQPGELGHLPAHRRGIPWHVVGQFRCAHLGPPPLSDPRRFDQQLVGGTTLRLAKAGTTTTTPIRAASATASPGMSSISTGSVYVPSIASALRRSSASARRYTAPMSRHPCLIYRRLPGGGPILIER